VFVVSAHVKERPAGGASITTADSAGRRVDLRVAGAVALVVAAAFYRPLIFWAHNAWDLASPTKILLVGAVMAFAGLCLLVVLIILGESPLPSGLALAALLYLLMQWHQVGSTGSTALLFGVLVIWWLSRKAGQSSLIDAAAVAVLAAIGLIPVVQVVTAHIEDRVPFPLVDLPIPSNAQPSGAIEDVMVVVVDTYPSLPLRRDWLGGNPDFLLDELAETGFTVPRSAWARHTYTALSVPSILSLQSVVEEGPTGSWGNRSSSYKLLRGDNYVSQTLESAGFSTVHIESGWDGSSCGPTVDQCIQSPWIDEPVFQLLTTSVAHEWLENRFHTVTGTLNTAAALNKELARLAGNASHDYIFAHFLLPHDPFLVNQRCEPLSAPVMLSSDVAANRRAYAAQLSCVDRLLSDVVANVKPNTAVLLTGDHGGNTARQLSLPPEQWTDADIAERFGVFLAYKLPSNCPQPRIADPMTAMGAVLGCAVGQRFDVQAPAYLIGADEPVRIDHARMTRIKETEPVDLLPTDAG
jgi:hypothetical protein